jgi:hypothetical protein
MGIWADKAIEHLHNMDKMVYGVWCSGQRHGVHILYIYIDELEERLYEARGLESTSYDHH